MADPPTIEKSMPTWEETIAGSSRLRAEIAEAAMDLTGKEHEALVEDLTHQVNEGLRRSSLGSRSEDVQSRHPCALSSTPASSSASRPRTRPVPST